MYDITTTAGEEGTRCDAMRCDGTILYQLGIQRC